MIYVIRSMVLGFYGPRHEVDLIKPNMGGITTIVVPDMLRGAASLAHFVYFRLPAGFRNRETLETLSVALDDLRDRNIIA
jgi:hypothetical protein